MRLAALIFGIIGALAHLIGAIFAMIIGLVRQIDSFGYADFAEGLLTGIGGVPTAFSSGGDFDRLFAMGILGLVSVVVAAVGIGFAMFKPKVAMWLMAQASFIGLVAIAVAYHSAPGLIILASFAMVLFLWAAALEYLDSKRQGSGPATADTGNGDEAGNGNEPEGEAAPA